MQEAARDKRSNEGAGWWYFRKIRPRHTNPRVAVSIGLSVNRDENNYEWCVALYERQAAGLILYGRAMGLGHAEAEDVVQEVFAAILQLREPPLQPENYLVRAFRNRVLNRRQSLFRRLWRELESKRWFEPSEGKTATEREAMECLARLPVIQREVIVLRIWHQRTFEEIGTLLGLSPNTAAGRYRYGMQKLRACVRDTSYERDERPELTGNAVGFLEAPDAVAEA
ncbi:MAG: sigma-70 family RNA polymerase sigma factor [Pedosphaera sp.]|nr:sigma-70 family RNA polymerase sigma factor [Pedosphaera sp.]